SKYVGMTMATLGVMLALCSAMLGGSRTEMIATMVEKASVDSRYQAVAGKYRLMMSELRGLHAFMQSDPEEAKKTDAEIKQLVGEAGESNGNLAKLVNKETELVMGTTTPTPS